MPESSIQAGQDLVPSAEPATRITGDDATAGSDTAGEAYDPDEELLVAERLRALGYIE